MCTPGRYCSAPALVTVLMLADKSSAETEWVVAGSAPSVAAFWPGMTITLEDGASCAGSAASDDAAQAQRQAAGPADRRGLKDGLDMGHSLCRARRGAGPCLAAARVRSGPGGRGVG